MTADGRRCALLQRLVAIFAGALFASTWSLWHVDAGSIQIPWLRALCEVPRGVDAYALGVLGLGLLGLLLRPQPSRWGTLSLLLVFAGLGTLTALDQHRLQPWVWQFLLFAAVFLTLRSSAALSSWRWITVSIYVYSAISKLDAAYLDEHGKFLLDAMLRGAGLELPFWTPAARRLLPMAFPIGELTIAGLLLIPATRRIGLAASVVMHALLMWTLGAVLGHEWGVVLWNGFFIAQNCVLFGSRTARSAAKPPAPSDDVYRIIIDPPSSPPKAGSPKRPERASVLGVLVTIAAILLPALERVGCWDHWPAWAVYSSRPEIVRVDLLAETVELPEEFRPYVSQQDEFAGTRLLNFDDWSYATRHCPIYPQLRYRIALARAVLEPKLAGRYKLKISSTPDPWTGRREEITADEKLLESFSWNIEPRR